MMLHWIAEYESKTKVPPAIDSPLLTVKLQQNTHHTIGIGEIYAHI